MGFHINNQSMIKPAMVLFLLLLVIPCFAGDDDFLSSGEKEQLDRLGLYSCRFINDTDENVTLFVSYYYPVEETPDPATPGLFLYNEGWWLFFIEVPPKKQTRLFTTYNEFSWFACTDDAYWGTGDNYSEFPLLAMEMDGAEEGVMVPFTTEDLSGETRQKTVRIDTDSRRACRYTVEILNHFDYPLLLRCWYWDEDGRRVDQWEVVSGGSSMTLRCCISYPPEITISGTDNLNQRGVVGSQDRFLGGEKHTIILDLDIDSAMFLTQNTETWPNGMRYMDHPWRISLE